MGTKKMLKRGFWRAFNFIWKLNGIQKKRVPWRGGKKYPNFSLCIQFLEKIEQQFGPKIGTLFSNQLLL